MLLEAFCLHAQCQQVPLSTNLLIFFLSPSPSACPFRPTSLAFSRQFNLSLSFTSHLPFLPSSSPLLFSCLSRKLRITAKCSLYDQLFRFLITRRIPLYLSWKLSLHQQLRARNSRCAERRGESRGAFVCLLLLPGEGIQREGARTFCAIENQRRKIRKDEEGRRKGSKRPKMQGTERGGKINNSSMTLCVSRATFRHRAKTSEGSCLGNCPLRWLR